MPICDFLYSLTRTDKIFIMSLQKSQENEENLSEATALIIKV